MGIDVHSLNFLRYAKKIFGDFGETITIGRQGFHVIESYTRDPYIINIIKTLAESKDDKYCEKLIIDYFGAKKVDSIDNSDYEYASIVHDMNLPIPSILSNKYDTIIDAGTIEHIYNVPLALMNCSSLCKPGGQIIHILPANNFCGHGFWQFSPELFFSLYSHENGYSDTEVFLADLTNINKWYKVIEPKNGKRVIVHTSNRLHTLVRTVLIQENFTHNNIQQSDYINKWQGSSENIAHKSKLSNILKIIYAIKKSKFFYAMISKIYHSYYRLRPAPTMKLNILNPGLIKCDIALLLKSD